MERQLEFDFYESEKTDCFDWMLVNIVRALKELGVEDYGTLFSDGAKHRLKSHLTDGGQDIFEKYPADPWELVHLKTLLQSSVSHFKGRIAQERRGASDANLQDKAD